MPYLRQEIRNFITQGIAPTTPGELNYVITQACNKYLNPILGYTDLNEVIGVLECVKQELYRRVVAPYEDKKKEENGDVF